MFSILTPFARQDARFLLDAYASFSRSTIEFEWVLQEDGTDPVGVPPEIMADPRVRYGANRLQLGAGGSRTLALLRAEHDLVILLDADDLLAPSALEVYAAAMEPHHGWSYGQCVAWEQRSVLVERSILPAGEYPAGALLEPARRLGHLPLYSLPGCYRRSLLDAIGGWPSLPRDEDTSVQLQACATTPGAILEEVTYIKRQHLDRTSVQPWMDSLRKECRTLVLRRLGLDLAEWENWVAGGAPTAELYTREPYEQIPRPASICPRCTKVHNVVWCPYCGERTHLSYE